MIYTPLTCRAMRLAYDAHHGQTDKAGLPYVFHPFHLAEGMDDEASVCVALLHDAVEDGGVALQDLEAEFPSEVTDAVRLLTREPGVDYLDYVRAIKGNAVATRVKLADLEHNSDRSRLCGIEGPPSGGLESLWERYARAREILEA